MDWTPEFSRRARGFAVYAALRSLGRRGVLELVDSSCDRATQFAERIATIEGCEVLNDVVLNQVLFRFADDETTNRRSPTFRRRRSMDGRYHLGRPAAIRLSVSNWRTSESDIDRTAAAFEAAISTVSATR